MGGLLFALTILSSISLQDCPDVVDIPSLVEPSTGKMNLEHLSRDLPKYKPWLSPHAWEEWEEFLATTDDLVSTQPGLDLNKWRLHRLVSAAIVRPVPPAASITNDTLTLLAKETTTFPQVCTYLIVWISLSYSGVYVCVQY